jgi:Helicase HerA, central domain
MLNFFKQFISSVGRLLRGGGGARQQGGKLDLGFRVSDGEVTRKHVTLSNVSRTMHIAVLGKTGTGKSSLLRHLSQQDIEADRGFLYFDLHGDATPFLLRTINARERRERRHLSDKLILLEPADPYVSVGLNPLEQGSSPDFIRVAEFAEVLKQRWALDRFGARTEELLRNTLYALSANGLTLVELAPFLARSAFRKACLTQVENAEIRAYFETRYDPLGAAMQAVMREPILNKTSAFTTDPHFRHIVGQAHSTFSLREAMDEGFWIIVNLDKGRLGEQSLTFGSLVVTMLKNALFTREQRSLFTVYCDEMRAAILAVGTHIFFQLPSGDATQVAQALDGGRRMSELLKNLPRRHFVMKSGPDRPVEVRVPQVIAPPVDYTELVTRSHGRWARSRVLIEREIAKRHKLAERKPDELLHDWE